MTKMKFNLIQKDASSQARLGQIITPRGVVNTPAFMPVGTLATVKTLSPGELKQTEAEIILGNTYHLLLRPGIEVFKHFGGIHNFMKWDKPVLTDSGGFQIFSLPKSRVISEEGASFRSYLDGNLHHLTPELSIEMQNAIGSDIMMVLDVCIESTATFEATKDAMDRTHRWALRSLKANQNPNTQALFAIVQGGVHGELRKQSAAFLTQHEFDGFAIGGLAVGESKNEREDNTELVVELLPQDKPRYLMGVGTPVDLLEAVKRGVDMFDCIIPTKLAQQGVAFTSQGEVKLAKQEYRLSDEYLDPHCQCQTCTQWSRGYLHHLTKCHETLGWRALAFHNFVFYQKLMQGMRRSIQENKFNIFYNETLNLYLSDYSESSREPAQLIHPKKKNLRRFPASVEGLI